MRHPKSGRSFDGRTALYARHQYGELHCSRSGSGAGGAPDGSTIQYGILRATLEASGTPLGNLDMQIAAHALAMGAILVTNDQAFARVPALALENWVSL